MLDLAKVEAGHINLQITEFSARDTLVDCTKLVGGDKVEDRIKIHLPVPDFSLRADPQLFKQIMINLISNAHKFTPEGGEIVISADTNEIGDKIISIADSGVGISESEIDKALEPFGQLRTSAHVSHEGTGLGLSISKKLMELHGGELEIRSLPNSGTIVELRFPQPD